MTAAVPAVEMTVLFDVELVQIVTEAHVDAVMFLLHAANLAGHS